jgi:hypothetical protein
VVKEDQCVSSNTCVEVKKLVFMEHIHRGQTRLAFLEHIHRGQTRLAFMEHIHSGQTRLTCLFEHIDS